MNSGYASRWLEVVISDVFLLSKRQMNRMKRYFSTPHGVKRVNNRRVISGIIYVLKNGLRRTRLRCMVYLRRCTTDLCAGA